MSAKFFTNKDKNTLLKKFEGIFKNNIDIENFDALVGFLRASGYFTLRPFLNKVPKIRILVGIVLFLFVYQILYCLVNTLPLIFIDPS